MQEVEPPPPGVLTFELDMKPRSLQSSSLLKRQVREQLAAKVQLMPYLLSGEVEVRVEWFLPERERIFGLHSPDVDNILKPLLDAISGPERLLINDCQVQSVRCSWIDGVSSDHKLRFEFRYSPDDWVRKEGLIWVEMRDKLCMPLNSEMTVAPCLKLLEAHEKAFQLRADILDRGGGYGLSMMAMSVQMPFHRARLRGFKVEPLAQIRARLQRLVAQSGPGSKIG